MNKLTLKQIAKWTNGTLVGEDKEIDKISIDSRDVSKGTLFVAINGERFDGHSFVADVQKNGASACLCHKKVDCDIPVIYVDDTSKAFLELAKNYRKSIENLTVIGLTGSVGKTTTKEMTYEVVCKKYNSIKTEGNLNNEIGLPKTLFRLDNDTEAAVIEMGMSNFGEISRLSNASCPDIGIITNIGVSHIEYLGSRDGILKAKLEILDGMKKGSPLILNADNDKLVNVHNSDYKIIFFGIENKKADVIASDIKEKDGCTEFIVHFENKQQYVIIPTVGIHNVYDALAAFAVGILLEIDLNDISEALKNYVPSGMRQRIKTVNNITVIEDCYNASPDSQKAAINVLSEMKCERKIAVLGDMLELGDYSQTAHSDVGRYVAQKSIDVLYTYGEQAKFIAQNANNETINVFSFDDKESLTNALLKQVKPGDAVLFKASRGMKLEEVIELLYKEWNNK